MADAQARREEVLGGIADMLRFFRALGVERIQMPRQAQRAASRAPAPGTIDPGKAARLQEIRDEIGDCRRCTLCEQRTNIVFGSGSPSARLMFIGEAPGRDEDMQGLPFVGDAGTVLTRLIQKMGLSREEVYIANIVKCRPPGNRDPEDSEIATCRRFLEKQIEIIAPEVIMSLGRIALKTLKNAERVKITSERGTFFLYGDIPVMPTFHPAYLLRNPADKWKTWEDACAVMARLGLAPAS